MNNIDLFLQAPVTNATLIIAIISTALLTHGLFLHHTEANRREILKSVFNIGPGPNDSSSYEEANRKMDEDEKQKKDK